jgi:hypothetical protein
VQSIGKRAGLGLVHPSCCGRASSWPPSTPGVPLREVQVAARHSDPRTTTVYEVDARTWIATPPTSLSPSSPAADPPARPTPAHPSCRAR